MFFPFFACETMESPALPELTVTANANVPTVLTATWTSAEPSLGKVSFGVVGEDPIETPWEPEPGTHHERVILGVPANAEVALTGQGDDGAETATTTVQTGPFPPEWPTWAMAANEATWTGYLFVGFSYGFSGIVALDSHGRPVWWWATGADTTVPDRVVPAAARDAVYVSLSGPGYERGANLATISWEGELLDQTPISRLTHDFLQRSDGTFAGIVETDHFQGDNVCYGNGIAEFSADGAANLVWDGWDDYGDVEFDCSTDPFGLLHLNALDWDDDAGEYVVDSRNLGTLSVVDRASGTLAESVGNYGDYTPDVADSALLHPHQFQRLSPDRYLVVDDGGEERLYSRVVELEINRETGLYSTVWSYRPNPDLFVVALGEVERLPSGNTLVDWSTAARLEEVDPSGKTVWQLDAEFGNAFTYMTRVDSLYAAE